MHDALRCRAPRHAWYVALLFGVGYVAACTDEASQPIATATEQTDVVTDVGRAPAHEGAPPQSIWIGINGFSRELMGELPVKLGGETTGFTWHVPRSGGFTVEVHAVHDGSFKPLTAPTFLCRVADRDMQPAPAPSSVFVAGEVGWKKTTYGHVWSGLVSRWEPDKWRADGACEPTVIGRVADVAASLGTVLPRALTTALDPFEKVDTWLVDFTRDQSDLQVSHIEGQFAVTTPKDATPDGVADFDEALTELGFLGGDADFNDKMRAYFKERVRTWMRKFYRLDPDTGAIGPNSVRIRFVFDGDKDAPAGALPKTWSKMAVGGEDAKWKPGGKVFFGRAAMDFHNAHRNINTAPDRGVFTSALVRLILQNPALSNLVVDYAPAAGGQPYGSVSSDSQLLTPGFDHRALPVGKARARGERFTLVARLLTLAIASITAHEIGHSLGLVKPGRPPSGLFGGLQQATWMAGKADHYHIDTPGLNIMQSGSSLQPQDLFGADPHFAPFNMAYLLRRIVVSK